MELTGKDKKIHSQRAARYGDATRGHRNLGKIYTGIINQFLLSRGIDFEIPDLPANVVLLLFAASKMSRAAVELKNPDDENYIDCKVYMELAKEAKKLEVRTK